MYKGQRKFFCGPPPTLATLSPSNLKTSPLKNTDTIFNYLKYSIIYTSILQALITYLCNFLKWGGGAQNHAIPLKPVWYKLQGMKNIHGNVSKKISIFS